VPNASATRPREAGLAEVALLRACCMATAPPGEAGDVRQRLLCRWQPAGGPLRTLVYRCASNAGVSSCMHLVEQDRDRIGLAALAVYLPGRRSMRRSGSPRFASACSQRRCEQQTAPSLTRLRRAGIILACVEAPGAQAPSVLKRLHLVPCSPATRTLGGLKSSWMTSPCSLPLHPSRSQEGPIPSLKKAGGSGRWLFYVDICTGKRDLHSLSIPTTPAKPHVCSETVALHPPSPPPRALRGYLLRASSDWN
jgi:hypothetical protein